MAGTGGRATAVTGYKLDVGHESTALVRFRTASYRRRSAPMPTVASFRRPDRWPPTWPRVLWLSKRPEIVSDPCSCVASEGRLASIPLLTRCSCPEPKRDATGCPLSKPGHWLIQIARTCALPLRQKVRSGPTLPKRDHFGPRTRHLRLGSPPKSSGDLMAGTPTRSPA
jgi:hypothetical protein